MYKKNSERYRPSQRSGLNKSDDLHLSDISDVSDSEDEGVKVRPAKTVETQQNAVNYFTADTKNEPVPFFDIGSQQKPPPGSNKSVGRNGLMYHKPNPLIAEGKQITTKPHHHRTNNIDESMIKEALEDGSETESSALGMSRK